MTCYIPFYTLFLADFLEEHRRVLESRLQPVVREITDSRARTREELESLYRKIVSAVLLRSGLGSPTDIAVVREATGTLTILLLTLYVCVGEWGWGVEGKQVGSMDEELQVRGCYNITFICTPTNQETVSVLEKTQANKTFRT